jgi:DNA-binding beta-propeller fold protein YncE
MNRTPLHHWLPLAAAIAVATPASAAPGTAYVLATDYQSPGSLSAIDLATRAVSADVATVHSDPRLRVHGGLLYVVNRFGQDNVQVIDPAQGYATVRQFSVGNGTNPQDIAFASPTRAYVTRLGSPDLLIVNPQTGATLGAIALGALADGDGLPEMDRMRIVGRRLFVTLQRLVAFTPTDTSLVAVIDLDTDTLVDCDPAQPGVQGIRLAGTNPVTKLERDPQSGRLLVGCAGAYGVNDGGVAWIDPATLVSGDFAVTGAALGGDVLDVEFESPSRAYAIVSENFATRLVVFRPADGAVLDTLFAPGGFSLADCERNDRGELYVCKSLITSPGVFVFDAASGSLLAGPLDTVLPPVEVAFDETELAAAANPAPTVGPPAHPNPARGPVRWTLRSESNGEISAQVFDAAGRWIRSVAAGVRTAGDHDLTWDLTDARGVRVRPGVYLIRSVAAGKPVTTRVVTLP